jgi:3-hydroxybutyryl-CoA dehydratase
MSPEIRLFENFKKEIYFTITEDVYSSFQNCSGDLNALHTDESFAKSKGFEGRVMYGNILNAFVSCAIGMHLPTKNVMIQTQEIQFKKPVYLGDELYMSLEVEELHESVNAVVLGFKFRNLRNILVSKGHVQIGILI